VRRLEGREDGNGDANSELEDEECVGNAVGDDVLGSVPVVCRLELLIDALAVPQWLAGVNVFVIERVSLAMTRRIRRQWMSAAYLYPVGLRSPLGLENVRLWGLELHLMADRL